MKFNTLKEKIAKIYKQDDVYLTNIYKVKNKRQIAIDICLFEGFGARYVNTLEMDYQCVIKRFRKSHRNLDNLVGTKVVEFGKYDFLLAIHDRPKSVGYSCILGKINSKGNAHFYSKRDFPKFNFPKTYLGNNEEMKEIGNYQSSIDFKSLLKYYEKNIESATIDDSGSKSFRIGLKFNDFEVSLVLNSFFNYKLDFKLWTKNNMVNKVSLDNPSKDEVIQVIEEFKSKKISETTKEKILLTIPRGLEFFKKENSNYMVYLRDSSTGYPIQFDHKNKKVVCINYGRGKKKIKQCIDGLNRAFKNMNSKNILKESLNDFYYQR